MPDKIEVPFDGPLLVLTVDHHETVLFDFEPPGRSLVKRQVLVPHDPEGHRRHLTHRDQTRLAGERAPEDPAYYKNIAAAIVAAPTVLVLGSATGKSSASEMLRHHLSEHAKAHLDKVVFRKIDLSALTEATIVDAALELYKPNSVETSQ